MGALVVGHIPIHKSDGFEVSTSYIHEHILLAAAVHLPLVIEVEILIEVLEQVLGRLKLLTFQVKDHVHLVHIHLGWWQLLLDKVTQVVDVDAWMHDHVDLDGGL